MSVTHTLVSLIEVQPRHGYDLKRIYDTRFGQDRPLKAGQVYAALGRLERNGFVAVAVAVAATGREGCPDRTTYAVTEQGVTDLDRWFSQPEGPGPTCSPNCSPRSCLPCSAVDGVGPDRAGRRRGGPRDLRDPPAGQRRRPSGGPADRVRAASHGGPAAPPYLRVRSVHSRPYGPQAVAGVGSGTGHRYRKDTSPGSGKSTAADGGLARGSPRAACPCPGPPRSGAP